MAGSAHHRLFPVEHAQRPAAAIPDARLEMIDDSLTLSIIEQPDEVAARIADFARPVQE